MLDSLTIPKYFQYFICFCVVCVSKEYESRLRQLVIVHSNKRIVWVLFSIYLSSINTTCERILIGVNVLKWTNMAGVQHTHTRALNRFDSCAANAARRQTKEQWNWMAFALVLYVRLYTAHTHTENALHIGENIFHVKFCLYVCIHHVSTPHQ